MAIKDVKTGSSDLQKYVTMLEFLKYAHLTQKRNEFEEKLKNSMKEIIQDIKPKKFLYAYPGVFNDEAESDEYEAMGWTRSSTLKSEFEITSELTNKVVFFATYSEKFSKPFECRTDSAKGHNYISGGGPERDTIKGGYGKDIISVHNDAVSDLDGDNIFMAEGSGNDDILVGPGADLAIIKKSSGTAKFSMHQWNHKTRDQQKPKRIVYDSDVRLTHGENNAEKDVIKGSYTYHDVLSMTNYKPDTSTQSPDQRIVLLNEGKTVADYISQISDVVDDLFEDHRGEVISDAHPGRALMVEDAQHIYFEDIERFELSKHCLNLLLLKNNEYVNTRHEVIGGDLDDYVVNLDDDIEVMAQMGTGANRVYSGQKNDAYSLILDDSKDVIYDRGGENIVAIMLQDGLQLEDVQIIRNGNNRYRIYKKTRQSYTRVRVSQH
ncbi:hypothetical protein OS493_027497 [Desmophyllum pertusum]|uniref:Uncharacterized protein n=1 Tax=Desmophyllum pertusum TaxID=174260 RepID=A0A9X0CFB4_9CNID|nr:hypothetical protein OS493_027497 [Desmophyllum pertusum]